MGWNVDSTKEVADDSEFVDSMSPSNYVSVTLPKPMGIVFEEVRLKGTTKWEDPDTFTLNKNTLL